MCMQQRMRLCSYAITSLSYLRHYVTVVVSCRRAMDAPPWAQDATWREHVTALAAFPRGLSILELCGGTSSPSVALSLLLGEGKHVLSGFYDIDANTRELAAVVHPTTRARLHIGAEDGDILRIACDDFPSCNVLVAGPPCPPFSTLSSNRRGWGDARSSPFLKVVDTICNLARRRLGVPLIFFILENVKGMLHRLPDLPDTPIATVLERLREELGSGWHVSYDVLAARDYGLPQSRNRVYIVGRRKSFCSLDESSIAAPGRHTDVTRMHDVIGNLPERQRPGTPSYTAAQMVNVSNFKEFYTAEIEDRAFEGRYAIFDRTRTPLRGIQWGGVNKKHVDICPCLTTVGPRLHVLGLGGGDPLPVDRELSAAEHGRLQGFPDRLATLPANSSASRKLWGNAMCVPVVGSVLARELRNVLSSVGTRCSHGHHTLAQVLAGLHGGDVDAWATQTKSEAVTAELSGMAGERPCDSHRDVATSDTQATVTATPQAATVVLTVGGGSTSDVRPSPSGLAAASSSAGGMSNVATAASDVFGFWDDEGVHMSALDAMSPPKRRRRR